MRTDKCRQRCPDCRRHTDHVVRIGRLEGSGPDAYHEVSYHCQVCGRVENTRRYPNLLADVFHVPTTA